MIWMRLLAFSCFPHHNRERAQRVGCERPPPTAMALNGRTRPSLGWTGLLSSSGTMGFGAVRRIATTTACAKRHTSCLLPRWSSSGNAAPTTASASTLTGLLAALSLAPRPCSLRASAVGAPARGLCAQSADPSSLRVPGVKRELETLMGSALEAAFPDQRQEPIVVQTTNPKFDCDYQCNNAMPLFARVKGEDGAPSNPRAVAEAIVASIPANDLVEEAAVAGPGFINLRLRDSFLEGRAATLFQPDLSVESWAPQAPCRRAVVDFSSPNVAKEMHVGHLRSTIIGDTLCRCLEFSGVDVKRLNHVGDWGTQFGMLIQHMEEEGVAFDAAVEDLQVLYKASKVRFDEDPEFKQRAQRAVVRLQGGDEESRERWGKICDASRREFTKIYDALGVTIEERGESFYQPYLEGLVGELLESGVAQMSDGAACVFVEGQDAPLIVRKSDGGYGYATTDLAALRQRLSEEGADWIVYLTDSGQAQHFRGVFAAARKCGWVPEEGTGGYPRVDHVGFGLVLGEDGKRLKTRSGDVVRLSDLLGEAVSRCKAQLVERGNDFGGDEEALDRVARKIGYSAIKYADLKQNKQSNYEFSFDRMLDLKGNTAVYLQDAHARVCSILAKAEASGAGGGGEGGEIRVTCGAERALLAAICQFPEAVEDCVADLAPNRLCEYLYGLTSKFTDFYGECQVVGSEEQASRVRMCEATLEVMRKCFFLLGMEPLDRI